MVRDPLQFTAAPFDGAVDPASFFCGATQEEALARLEWLVGQRQRCGLVVAGEGLGKSHLAAMAVRRLGGLGAEVALLSLRGLPEGEWLDMLLGRLPLDPASRAEPIRSWLKLENRLRENTLMERPTVLVFDDLDAAPADARDGIAWLATASEPRFASTLVVGTCTPAGLASVPEAIRQRAAVRIEIEPWSAADVAEYVAQGLARVGVDPEAFTPAAVATLGRFSGGAPRLACRLAHLAAVAAAGEGLERVEAATVERAWRELAPDCGSEYDDVAAAGSPAQETRRHPAPQVRAVRRLWG
jgi:hypothetical protein